MELGDRVYAAERIMKKRVRKVNIKKSVIVIVLELLTLAIHSNDIRKIIRIISCFLQVDIHLF